MRRILAALLVAIIFALLWATAFSAELEQVWVQRTRFDSQRRLSPFYGVSAAVDRSGRIYSVYEGGQPGASDMYMRVHGSKGDVMQDFVYRGNGTGDDRPRDLITVPGGDGGFAVTGETYASGTAKLMLRMSNWSGTFVRTHVLQGTGFSSGYALSSIDRQTKIAVAGAIYSEKTDADFYVAAYDMYSGRSLWESVVDGGHSGADYPQRIAADAQGNVCVAGYSVRPASNSAGSIVEITILKLAAADGRMLWRTIFGQSIGYDYPHGLAVDQQGNVFITGQAWNGTDYDMITSKYSGGSGEWRWSVRTGIRGAGTLPDSGSAIAVTANGDVVVTGTQNVSLGKGAPNRTEFVTLCYSGTDGSLKWTRSFSGSDNTFNTGYDVAVDGKGFIWVTGVVSNAGQTDFYTARLNDQGEVLASSVFDGFGSREDSFTKDEFTFHQGHKLALTSDGVVLIGTSNVAGVSEGVLVKYRYSATAPVVTTGVAANISADGAVLNGTVEGQGAAGTAWLEWGETPAYGTKGPEKQFPPSGIMAFNEAIQSPAGRERHFTYNFRAASSTDTGTVYGANRTFVTNTAPVATPDRYHCRPGEALDFAVLGNDSDSDGDSLSIIAASNGAHGTVAVGAGGVLRYTPRESFKGNDSFTYTIADGFGGQATATVSLVNNAPVANTDVVEVMFDQVAAIPVIANDLDANDDVLDVPNCQQGKHGSVGGGWNGVLYYLPDPEFIGADSFTYELSDGWTTVRGTVSIRVLPPSAPVIHAAASSSLPVPDTEASVPQEAKWLSFGQPATDLDGHLAFAARIVSQHGVQAGIFEANQPSSLRAVALSGQLAPGFNNGARFVSFNDPSIASFIVGKDLPMRSAVAFTGALSDPGSATGNLGLWTTATNSGRLQLVLYEGARLPVEGASAVTAEIQSFAVVPSGLWIVARLAQDNGVVARNNDIALLFWNGWRLQMHLREGDLQLVGGKPKYIRTLAALAPARGTVGGFGGSDERSGAVVCRVTFTDGTQALTDGTTLVATNDVVGDEYPGARWARFGIPTIAGDGKSEQLLISFAGEMRVGPGGLRSLNDRGIFIANTGAGVDEGEFLVRRNDPVPGLPGIKFAAFKDPVISPGAGAAFVARLAGRGVSGKNREALFWSGDDSLRMLARQGQPAPGVPEAVVSQISAVALRASEIPGYLPGPVFEAQLKSGSVGVGDGLWATDSKGTVHLILRSGADIAVGEEMKKLYRFSMLGPVNGSSPKRQALDGYGRIVGRATFTDGSQAILRVILP